MGITIKVIEKFMRAEVKGIEIEQDQFIYSDEFLVQTERGLRSQDSLENIAAITTLARFLKLDCSGALFHLFHKKIFEAALALQEKSGATYSGSLVGEFLKTYLQQANDAREYFSKNLAQAENILDGKDFDLRKIPLGDLLFFICQSSDENIVKLTRGMTPERAIKIFRAEGVVAEDANINSQANLIKALLKRNEGRKALDLLLRRAFLPADNDLVGQLERAIAASSLLLIARELGVSDDESVVKTLHSIVEVLSLGDFEGGDFEGVQVIVNALIVKYIKMDGPPISRSNKVVKLAALLDQEDRDFLLLPAANYGLLEVLEDLVELGADIRQHRLALLICAAGSGHQDLLEFVIEGDLQISDEKKNGLYSFALICAAENNHLEMVEALIKRDGVNIEHVDRDNFTALSIAAKSGHPRIVSTLIAAGANVNHGSREGEKNPLILAVQCLNKEESKEGYLQIVQLLIDGEANINVADLSGNTALMLAAIGEDLAMVEALMGVGADSSILNSAGESADDITVKQWGFGESKGFLSRVAGSSPEPRAGRCLDPSSKIREP
jgi:ankyrin repeat protein